MQTSRVLFDCALACVFGALLGAYTALHSSAPAAWTVALQFCCALSFVLLLLVGRDRPALARVLFITLCASALSLSADLVLTPKPSQALDETLLQGRVQVQGEVSKGCRPVAPPCSFEALLWATAQPRDGAAMGLSPIPSLPPSKAGEVDQAPIRTRIYLTEGRWSPLPGDLFEANGKLRRPMPGLHPFAFDPATWSERQGIDASFHMDGMPTLTGTRRRFARRIDAWRAHLEYAMMRPDREEAAGILIAMSTGTKSGLSDEVRARFAAAGTAHVLAVSGLHLGLLAGVLWWTLTRVFRRFPRLLRRWNADALSSLITLPVLFIYVIFTGMPTSAMRAGWMAAALLISRIFHRRGSNLHGLCLAVVILLAQNPRLIVDLGFQLSVSATLSLILLARGLQSTRKARAAKEAAQKERDALDAHDRAQDQSFVFGELDKTTAASSQGEGSENVDARLQTRSQEQDLDEDRDKARLSASSGLVLAWRARAAKSLERLRPAYFWTASAIEVSVVSTLATAPFLVWNFGGVPIFSPIPNLLVVPPLSVVALPLGVLGAGLYQLWPAGGVVLIDCALWVIDRCLDIARAGAWLFEQELLLGRPATAGVIGWALVAMASPFIFRPRQIKWWIATAVGVLAIGADSWSRAPKAGTLEIHAIPVGQGDATWVRLPGKRSLLIDAGGVGYGDSKTGAKYVLPYLRAHGVQHVDVMVATHGHADHANGVTELLPLLKPSQVWVGADNLERPVDRALYDVARAHGVPYIAPHRHWEAVHIGKTRIEILPMGMPSSINDGSLMLRICYEDFCALMTGDAEAEREQWLVQHKVPLAAQYLKVGHHGSNTSTTPAFLARVRPQVAVIELGADNQFKFPHAPVLERLQSRGVQTWRTDRAEAVVHVTDGYRLWRKRSHLWPDVFHLFRLRKREGREGRELQAAGDAGRVR